MPQLSGGEARARHGPYASFSTPQPPRDRPMHAALGAVRRLPLRPGVRTRTLTNPKKSFQNNAFKMACGLL
ncbi:hypothetical protein XpiCFBP4643_10465 [Xanthomonas pisi]|uniref:Uncharacterized protein n=1 Tax=Xanthomonas pisi TaxID=56457 RepID=A0A2S7D3M8_9XANT|nr:hypothetical protein XpiCFBP4643_10465 [Xanthomonas pisi]